MDVTERLLYAKVMSFLGFLRFAVEFLRSVLDSLEKVLQN